MPTVERAVPGTLGWVRMQADHLARYLQAAQFVKDKRVLDAGSGPGYGTALLADAGASEVIGVDIDRDTVTDATAKYSQPRLQFVVDDCEEFRTVAGTFDIICSFENIEHLNRPERFLERAAQLLSRDGVLMCSTPDREGPYEPWKNGKPNNPFHTMEWYANEFQDLVGRYFDEVDFRAQVMSYAAVQRGEAFRGLVSHLDYLWSNPILRAQRVLLKLMGRSVDWPTVTGFDIPSPQDFPISAV